MADCAHGTADQASKDEPTKLGKLRQVRDIQVADGPDTRASSAGCVLVAEE